MNGSGDSATLDVAAVTSAQHPRPFVWDIRISIPTAFLLAVLGILKLTNVSAKEISWLDIIAGVSEILGAALLLLGCAPTVMRPSLLFVASVFLGASLAGAVMAHDCNCFGRLNASPADRILVAALLLTASLLLWGNFRRPWVIGAMVGACATLGAGIELTMDSFSDGRTTLENLLPLEARRGSWDVTLVRATCPACRDHLRRKSPHVPWTRKRKRLLIVLGPPQPWLRGNFHRFDAHRFVPEEDAAGIRAPQDVVVVDGRVLGGPDNGK